LAIFERKAIENVLHRAGHEVATEILTSRTVGQENATPEVITGFEDIAQSFYDENIKPREAAAASNCALYKELARFVFPLGKTVHVMGGDPKFLENYEGDSSCQFKANCLAEAKELCKQNAVQAAREFYSLARGITLTGVCSIPDEDDFFEDCSPEWYGSISYSEGGSTNEVSTFGGGGVGSTTTTVVFLGSAHVAYAATFPGGIQLEMEGFAEGVELVHSLVTSPLSCGKVHKQENNSSAVGTGVLKLNLFGAFTGSKLTFLTLSSVGNLNLSKGYITSDEIFPSCLEDGKDRVYHAGAPHTSKRSPALLNLIGPPFETPPFGNTDEIVGEYTTATVKLQHTGERHLEI
jgi:hypothetical protein